MIDYKDPKVIQVARVKCSQSVLTHTRYFHKRREKKKYIVGEPHKIICEALERVLRGELKRLIINIAPRYGKTELAVKSFISHGLALNAKAKFIHLSYSDSLALDNSEAIKDLIESEEYQDLFPEVKIKRDAKAKDKWYTTAGGGLLARSTAGQVTGFGAGEVEEEKPVYTFDPDLEDPADDPDPDLTEFLTAIQAKPSGPLRGRALLDAKWTFSGAIVIDDPVKPEDADSETKRRAVNERYDSTIKNRVNSRHTPIIVIGQRVHPEDLSGYLMRDDEADEWEVISLPCIKEDGTALWPHKHTVEELKKLETANELVFGRQYMQDPSPKSGLLFPIQDLNFYDHDELEKELEDPDYTYIAADPADEGGDDFASGPAKLLGDRIYITDMIYNTDGTDVNELAFRKMVAENKCNYIGFEGVLGWRETARRVREDIQKHGYAGEYIILKPTQKKHTRIVNRASFIRNHIYFRSDWQKRPQYAKFVRNVIAYLKIQETGASNKHDDGPDFLEMVASHYEKNFPALWAMINK